MRAIQPDSLYQIDVSTCISNHKFSKIPTIMVLTSILSTNFIYLKNSLFSFALKLCIYMNLSSKEQDHYFSVDTLMFLLIFLRLLFYYLVYELFRKIASPILYFFRSPHPFPWRITPWIVWPQSLSEHQPINSDARYSVWQ